MTNGYPSPPSTCESLSDDLDKDWIGVGTGQDRFPGCTVYNNGNMAFLDNTGTEESHEKHIVGYEFVRTGECSGGEKSVYSLSENPCTGDGFDCIEKCYKECKRQNDLGIYVNKGFIVHDTDSSGSSNGNVGGCYCEALSGRECTPEVDAWDRFDYIYKGFKPTLDAGAVSKTCGTTCPTGLYKYGTVCVPCKPGTRCPGDNFAYYCPVGEYAGSYNNTVCQSCAPGKFSGGGATECTECAAGKYSGYKLVHDGRPDKSVGYHLCKKYAQTTCPESHPYVYRASRGYDYCCSTNQQTNQVDPADRGDLCHNHAYVACSSPPCRDHETVSIWYNWYSWFPANNFEEVDLSDRPQGCYVDMTASDRKLRWNKNFGNKVCSPMYPCVQRMTTCEDCPAGRFNLGTGNDKCSKIPDGRYGTTLDPDWTGSYGHSQCSAGFYRKMWRKVVDGNSNDATVTYDDCKVVAAELGFNFYEFSTSRKIDYGGTLTSSNLPMHSCGGDCDYDSDCAGNMKCFQTQIGIIPPGCNSGMSATHDWCYTPSETLTTNVYDGANNIPLCGGDCDSDSNCAADYICFHRGGLQAIPGCAGSGANGNDYCVSPQSYTKLGLKEPAVVGSFDSSLLVSPKGCFMQKGETNTLYYNNQDSPAACTEDRPCVQYTVRCTKCGSGKYSSMGAKECTNCEAGKFSQNGAAICSNCGAGTYDSHDWGIYVITEHPSNSWWGLGEGNVLSCDDCKTYAEQNGLTFHSFYSSSGSILGVLKHWSCILQFCWG